MQWNTQAGNITTNLKVDFTLPALSATNILTWNCHVDESKKGRPDMILEQDLWTEIVLNLKWSEHVIEADDVPLNGSTTPMVNLGTYIFKDLNTGEIKPGYFFTNAYVEEVYESEHEPTATERLNVILDAKYEKENLHKVMENQYQHLTMTQRN